MATIAPTRPWAPQTDLTAAEAKSLPDVPAPKRRRPPGPSLWWFSCVGSVYLAAGALLAFHYESFNGDAQARVANAFYVMFSRDPHLAAIGFVWNPLPSMTVMPVLLLSKLWPPLAERAFAGNILSAVCMAAAVAILRGILGDLRVRRGAAVLLTLLFAFHPMIAYHGANGLSEGLFLLTLMVATRYLIRYLDTGAPGVLVGSGVSLGIAYYARNEAIAAIALATAVVLFARARTTEGAPRERFRAALVDAVLLVAPGLFAFVSWAAASWLIVGSPFEQFSSEYGTASQLQAMTAVGFQLRDTSLATRMVILMAPMLGVSAALAGARAWRRRDIRPLAPAAVLGGVLAFALAAYLGGQTAGWFRYFITAVPLTILLAGFSVAPAPSNALKMDSRPDRAGRRAPAALAVAVSAALAGPSIVGGTVAMSDPRVGQEEYLHLAYAFKPGQAAADGSAPTPRDRSLRERELFPASIRIATYLDGLNLPDGSIVTDTFSPCVPFMVLASERPKQFVITNDRDFEQILGDPVTFGARYLLVPSDSNLAQLDAINREYPSLARDGAGIASLGKEIREVGCPVFRLYEVNEERTR